MSTNSKLQSAIRQALYMSAGAGALAIALAPNAFAQDTDTDEENAQLPRLEIEETVVTGSRIKRAGYDTISPVTVVGSDDIKVSGQTRIEDLMGQLPQVAVPQNSYVSNGSTGTAELDLRALGSVRTLVLVNGRRLQPGGHYGNAPDVNQIPSALVDRVEVLTGGASATYGADAVAGVVNFIMKKDFEGLQIDLGMQGYQHKNRNGYLQGLMDEAGYPYPTGNSSIDGKSYNIDITMGSYFADGNGHATAYFTWRTNDELREGSRDYSSCALDETGTVCGGSANAIHPNFIAFTNDFSDAEYYILDPNSDGFIGGYDNWNPVPYNYGPINHFMRPDTRFSGGAFVDYEINQHVKPYMEVMFMKDSTRAQIAESGTFFNTFYNIPLSSTTLSDTQRQTIADRFGLDPATDSFQVLIGKRNVEGGPRTDILEHNSFRIVLGTSGDINDHWSYDVSYLHGETSSSTVYINDFIDSKIMTALDPAACAAATGCSVYDVFTYDGVTPEQASYVAGIGTLKGITKERIANAYITGDLGISFPTAAAPISLVVGVETREEVLEVQADDVFEQGLLLGQGGATPSVDGDYNVDEVFGELHLPLIDGNMELSVDLAYRYSDYNLYGGEDTYKAGFTFAPIQQVRLRAGYNRAVRVPNVFELFTPQSNGLWTGVDPCAGPAEDIIARGYTQEMCANTGVTPAQFGNVGVSPAGQYNALYGGNPDLIPEEADTYTVGIVSDPMDQLRISVDWWKINIDHVIQQFGLGGQLVTEQCAKTGAPVFCDKINRGPTGSLWAGKDFKVIDTAVNQGAYRWEGVDLALHYGADVGPGHLDIDFSGTRMIEQQVTPLEGDSPEAIASIYTCKGTINPDCLPATPKWRHLVTTTYDMGDWNVNLRWRYQGKLHYDRDEDTIANKNLDAQSYFDLSGGYVFNEHLQFLVGCNNIFDKSPPLVGNTITINANVPYGNYDILGRNLFASVTLNY